LSTESVRTRRGGEEVASIKCKDLGMKCGFEVKDENQDEMMQILALHAEKTHNIKEFPNDLMEKVKKAIKK
jgi:predicted small metal-binding protein